MKTLDCCCAWASVNRRPSWFQNASRVFERNTEFCVQFHHYKCLQQDDRQVKGGQQTCVCGNGFLFKLNNHASTKERIYPFLNFVVCSTVCYTENPSHVENMKYISPILLAWGGILFRSIFFGLIKFTDFYKLPPLALRAVRIYG